MGGANRTTGQHVLPRFLLNAFASHSRKKQHYAFLFRRGATNCEANTRDIGKGRLFYGEPSITGVEDALGAGENRYAPVHRRILATGELTGPDLDVMLEFVGQLAIRGGHLRDGFADATRDFVGEVMSILRSDTAEEYLQQQVVRDPRLSRRHVRAALARLPNLPQEPRLRLDFERKIVDALPEMMASIKVPLRELVAPFLAGFAGLDWNDLMKQGHIEALQEQTTATGVEKTAKLLHWTLLKKEAHSFVLGDVGPIARRPGDDVFSPLLAVVAEADVILMPLAHDRILAGHRSHEAPEVRVDQLIRETAELSRDFFVASRCGEVEVAASTDIGARCQLISTSERAKFIDDFEARLRSPNAEARVPRAGDLRAIAVEHQTEGAHGPGVDAANAAVDGIGRVVSSAFAELADEASGVTRVTVRVTTDFRAEVEDTRRRMGLAEENNPLTNQTMKIVQSRTRPTHEATLVVDAGPWENAQGVVSLFLCFEFLYRLAQVFIDANQQNEPDVPISFREHLEETAKGLMRTRRAASIAGALLPHFANATRADGTPLPIGDALALEYAPAVDRVLAALDEFRARVEDTELTDPVALAWEARNVVLELLELLQIALGVATEEATVRDALSSTPRFDRYLRENWEVISSHPSEGSGERLARAFENLMATAGLHVADPLDGSLVVTLSRSEKPAAITAPP